MKKVNKDSRQQIDRSRKHRITFLINDDEDKMITRYLEKYKIENKSRWCRETLMRHIFRTLEEDYPTLFNENEMRR